MKNLLSFWFTTVFCTVSFLISGEDACKLNAEKVQAVACQQNCCPCFMPSFGYHPGQGVGYNRSYLSYDFFCVPFQSKSSLFFLDIRNHAFTNGKYAGNAGIGARYQAKKFVLGGNFYYDVRNDHRRYQQLGAGVELLSPCVDVRLNGYFPIGKQSRTLQLAIFDDFIGDYFEICRFRKSMYSGFDAEIGRCLYSRNCCNSCFYLYAALGTYYYDTKKSCQFWGAQARVKASLTQYLSVEVLATTDRVFHERVRGAITLSIPFGGCCNTCVVNPACLPPVRREIIVLDNHCHYISNF